MIAGTLKLGGKRFVIVPEDEYRASATPSGTTNLPPLPKAGKNGNVPAIEFARATLARDVILARREMGLSQAQLARLAGIAPETLNRIEHAKITASIATVEKIDRALRRR